MLSDLLFILGIVYTYFIPGFIVIEVLFPKFSPLVKLPTYIVLSLLLSTYTIYFASLLFGFTAPVVALTILCHIPLFIVVLWKRHYNVGKEAVFAAKLAFAVALLFFAGLYPGIFTFHNDYFVLSAVNWQDTAMHLGIIQSLTQGNFPPQAPYYSGVPLSYYYFADFHAAILSILKGSFFPRTIVYDNALLAGTFFLSVYALVHEITRNRKSAVLGSLITVFYGNLMFIKYLGDVADNQSAATLAGKVLNTLSGNGYTIDFNGIMQIAPMADYLLQNRPMMIGLPAAALITLYSYKAVKDRSLKAAILSGLLGGLVVKFQLFAFVTAPFVFGVFFLYYLWRRVMASISLGLAFVIPFVSLGLFFMGISVNNSSIIALTRENFSFGVWNGITDIWWHTRFWIENFGIQLILLAIGLIIVSRGANAKKAIPLLFITLVMFAIPYFMRFTILDRDMYKFYYLAVVYLATPLGMTAAYCTRTRIGVIIIGVIMLAGTATSLLTIGWSATNKNMAYSISDYNAGLWIREYTPQRAVFLTHPTVHSSVTQIGGRLRVLSYINWPHSHGYRTGEDNVFVRLNEVESFYRNVDSSYARYILAKYSVDYVYYGTEERRNYPEAEAAFHSADNLMLTYTNADTTIWKVLR